MRLSKGRQIADLRGWDLRCFREVELIQRLQAWQLRVTDTVGNGMTIALFTLDRQQRFQVAHVAVLFFDRLFGQWTAMPHVPY